jgi:hypothetical protein
MSGPFSNDPIGESPAGPDMRSGAEKGGMGKISGPMLARNLYRDGVDLAFRNTLSDTQLLYIDVNNERIGVNLNNPSYELEIFGTTRTIYLITDDLVLPNLRIEDNEINAVVGNINLNAADAIVLSNLETSEFTISDNRINTIRSNADIDLIPNGTGTVDIYNNLRVLGDLHATGNITLDGTITFGNELSQDTVDFNVDIDSDIIPDQNEIYDLGRPTKRWLLLEAQSINGNIVTTSGIDVAGTLLSSRQGNIFYVAVNGNDSNVGDHPQGPFATIGRALDAADASNGGPVTVFVFPGTYQETLPLVIPSNVSIIGEDIRNTIVVPDTGSQSEDVFHMNGETTVQNLTIKDFYYDSVNNTGYAFRFAPNAVTTTRSPYIQNVSVITKGSVTSISDPNGFNAGDAGKGAWVDGSEMNPISFDASMLFHSITMITPGVDAVTMTNGVRVEWLNSFTYFANRGLYAVRGTTGRTSQDGSTVAYGAELRSIGSANVYGNYGAVADGADTLMYLILHNFAFIGSGNDSSNDSTLSIQGNEAVKLNNGKIYYQSHNKGKLRIGEAFFVDLERGTTSVDLSTLTTNSLSGLVINTGTDTTTITGSKLETGNIRVSGNLIQSLTGDLNIVSATDEINLLDNTTINANLDIVGNFNFDGSLNLIGNAYTDTVDLNVDIRQNFNPNLDTTYDLGALDKQWSNAWLSEANVNSVRIFDNVIQTQISNANLELRANGTGKVLIPNSNVSFNNDLTVIGNTLLDNNVSVENLNLNGDVGITGDISVQSQTVDGFLSVTEAVQFEEILIDDNVITTASSNANLELRAEPAGTILIPNSDVLVSNSLGADNIYNTGSVTITNDVTFNAADIADIDVTQNYITTNNSDLDLELSATGDVVVPLNNIILEQNLTVDGITSLQNTTIVGTIDQLGLRTQVGNYTQTGNLNQSGNISVDRAVQFADILVNDNVITTTLGNNDLDLRASGTGRVLIPNNDVRITNNLFAATITTGDIIVDQDIDLDDIVVRTNNIQINDNYITTSVSNSDLELRATGDVIVPTNNVVFEQDLTVNGNTSLKNVTINGTVTHTGNSTQTGNYSQTGNLTITGQLFAQGDVRLDDIQIVDNFISTTNLNENLVLDASGTGDVLINDSLRVAQDLSARSLVTGNLTIDNTFALEALESSTDIQIFDNVITTTNSNSNLELRANGVGDVRLENVFVNADRLGTRSGNITLAPTENITISSTGAFKLPSGTTLQRSNTVGDLRFNTSDNVFEARGLSNTITFNGVYSSDRITNLVAHPTNNTLNLTINTAQLAQITASGLIAHRLDVDDIVFDNNAIFTNVSNSDLELRTDGTGELLVEAFTIKGNVITPSVTDAPFRLGGTGQQWVVFEGDHAVKFPSGDTSTRPLSPVLGQTRHNTDTDELETWVGDRWQASAGQFDAISEAQMEDEAFIQTLIYG